MRTSPANRTASSFRRLPPVAALLFSLFFSLLLAGSATGVSFQVDFVNSTYDTQPGDTFSDLLLQHTAGTPIQSTVTQGLENISTAVYAGGITSNYSMLLSTTLDITVAGAYTFQVGTDWGRGGASALIDNSNGSIVSERVIDSDLWWAYNWSNSDVFTTTHVFDVGDSYTLMWVGFEDCCGGSTTLRFSIDASPFAPLTEPNITPFAAPEPGTALLVGIGLAVMSARIDRRVSGQAPSLR